MRRRLCTRPPSWPLIPEPAIISPTPAKPRILYVCCERIVPGSAAATHVLEICEGLERRGYPVRLQSERGDSRSGLGGQLGRYARITVAALKALRQADLVYFRSHFAAFPIALAAKLLGKPTIQEINGVYAEAFVTHPRFRRLKGILSTLQRWQYRWASALIAVTPELVAWGSSEAGHARAHHVGNGANTKVFTPHGPRAQRDRPYAFFFGGMTRWHGVEVMLQAARSPAWPKGVDLLMAGPVVDESLRSALRDALPPVTWLDRVPQPELPALIRGSVAALVPSVDPSGITVHGITPLKLFEMLACGRPVVVSDFRGMADLVRSGACGLVVPSGDPEALAGAVARLAADASEAQAMGEAGARLIAASHSWDVRAAETAAVIDQVVAQPIRR
ncbi:glycosyltransferase family 4 protein [Microvirga rosea]|uniref:glycosyltransferase family 4 protein n=1 Tax=Microvirga rosea TaxID=2715425 RepID=UPI001D0A1A60|nr:glycosyltransferase family 4 protein [Microvirga rosea]MCB8819095.1 glycosyltransferase family 4 protein [Microvirga rosea]